MVFGEKQNLMQQIKTNIVNWFNNWNNKTSLAYKIILTEDQFAFPFSLDWFLLLM